MPNQPAGVFWAVVNRLLIIFQVIILILSEIGWPSDFFEHYFPVLGRGFGLGPLGIFQCLIGATILSHHVDDFTLVAAFFLFAIGCLNMFLGLIFREGAKQKRSLTFWKSKDASKSGLLPSTHDLRPQFARPVSGFVSSLFNGNNEKNSEPERQQAASTGFGFGKKGEKSAGLKGAFSLCLSSDPIRTSNLIDSLFRQVSSFQDPLSPSLVTHRNPAANLARGPQSLDSSRVTLLSRDCVSSFLQTHFSNVFTTVKDMFPA